MSEPPMTYTICVLNQPPTTVQVSDLAELVKLLEDMHREGMLIEAVLGVTDAGAGEHCSPQPNKERMAE